MKSKYFGIITDKDFLNKESIDQDNFLVEKKLFVKKARLRLNLKFDDLNIGQIVGRGNTQNMVFISKPVKEILPDLYSFLKNNYIRGIKGVPFSFFSDFDQAIFGQKEDVIYEYASREFIKTFELICPKQYQIFKENSNGIIKLDGYFKSLKNRQDMAIIDLENDRDLIIQFLAGNSAYFNRELYNINRTVIDIVKFEGHLMTLLDLNDKYAFEKENYFSLESEVDFLDKAFEGKMEIDVLRFIDVCIKEIKRSHHSRIVALHRFLKNENKMNGVVEKQFRDAINKFYSLKLSRLKVSESAEFKHAERVDFYAEKWKSFPKSDG